MVDPAGSLSRTTRQIRSRQSARRDHAHRGSKDNRSQACNNCRDHGIHRNVHLDGRWRRISGVIDTVELRATPLPTDPRHPVVGDRRDPHLATSTTRHRQSPTFFESYSRTTIRTPGLPVANHDQWLDLIVCKLVSDRVEFRVRDARFTDIG